MRARVLAAVLLGSILVPIQVRSATLIPANSRVFIAPADGFDGYLSDALERIHTPLSITTDRSKADFVIETATAVRVVNAHSGDVVFVWSDHRKIAHSRKSAEACARMLARSVQTPPRHKSVEKDPVWQF